MKRSQKALALMAGLLIGGAVYTTVHAAENTGQRTIVDIGCDNVDTMCYVDISGSPAGGSVGCPSNTIVWDEGNDPNGRVTYASMWAAFVAGKEINIYINSCSTSRPTYPTIYYYSVYN